ncbi:MAG: hypothetical protein ACXWNK_09100 [Vulcanimicrobiaceae bacterium]
MLLGPPKSAGAASDRTERWVGRAASPVDAAKDGFHDQTIRMVVHVSIGGSAVRIRLSNAFGEAPLTIGHVTVGLARSTTTSFAVANSLREVTFAGSGITIVPQAAALVERTPQMNRRMNVRANRRRGNEQSRWASCAYQEHGSK